MNNKVCVAVTGAAGQIGYSLLFRLASGEVFGPNTQVNLRLLELPQAVKAAEGTAMELLDCGFSTLGTVNCYDEPQDAFKGCNWALLVGSKPREKGMERSDLIRSNGPIFVKQGKALLQASSDVRVVVVGNPCNTNALIAMHNSQDIPAERFSAMTALDENRAKAQVALKASVSVSEVSRMTIWGNHSTTMYPDFENCIISGEPLLNRINDRSWLQTDFIKTVQNRGAEIIAARGKSSAASAASACLDHMKSFLNKTPSGLSFSAAVPSNGEFYGAPKGVMFSFPLLSDGNGSYSIMPDLVLSDFAKEKIHVSSEELLRERSIVKDLLVM